MKYCTQCTHELSRGTPPGDDRQRWYCGRCGEIHYENPKMVVGCIPQWEDRILFCRRAIEPRSGYWTLPAGFMENSETTEEGALRELMEEAGARLAHLSPFSLFDLPLVSQIYLFFHGPLDSPTWSAGVESLEVRLFKPREIPWGELAFPVVTKTLRLFLEDQEKGAFGFHTGVIRERI
jgi:ADP-ribose pyrophosphatase YjhB (NUDIX family)